MVNFIEVPNWLVIEYGENSVMATTSERNLFQSEIGYPLPDMVYLKATLKIILFGETILSWTPIEVLKNNSLYPPKLFDSQKYIQLVPQWTPSSLISPSPIKYDWTYTSTFDGLVKDKNITPISNEDDITVFDKKILHQNADDPIIFSHSLLFYEDEIGDHGKSIFSVRIRLTTKYMFILSRSWIELSTQGIYRSVENRWMINTNSAIFRHEFTIKELVDPTITFQSNSHDIYRDFESSKLVTIFEKIERVN